MLDADLAQSLFAGWVAGAVAGMIATVLLMVLLARRPALATRLPWQQRLPILGIVVANALVIVLTMIGLVLGALFHRTGGPESSEVAARFGLYVAGGALALAALYVFVRGRVRTDEAPAALLTLVIAGLSFGMVLPWLGSLGR